MFQHAKRLYGVQLAVKFPNISPRKFRRTNRKCRIQFTISVLQMKIQKLFYESPWDKA